ncbi:DUF3857 domain-containing protein [Sphingobacterium corticibacter]|nr:DUF3857 domain-containing protein [Sphingobacterium corticibacter]
MAQSAIKKVKSPDWIRVSALTPSAVDLDDVSDGYYIERQEYQVHVGLQERYHSSVRVIHDEEGLSSAGQVSVLFDPSYQSILLHDLSITRDGKRIDKTDTKLFKLLATESDLSRAIYNGTYSAYCIIDDLRKGDRINISYTIKGFNPVFDNKFFDYSYLQGYEPIGLLLVNYVVPKSRNLHFSYAGGAEEMQVLKSDQVTSYYYEKNNLLKGTFYDYVPSWYVSVPTVSCSEFSNWQEVAAWATKVNPIPILTSSQSLSVFADELWKKAGGNKVNYFKLVTDFVQNEIRYQGVEMGEFSHRANNPEKVFRQRYGDCKDKSVLLATLLKYKKIDSGLGLVNSYIDHGLKKQIPSPQSFNHMVVWAAVDGRKQWIDATVTQQGGNILYRYFPWYGAALNLSSGNVEDLGADQEAVTHISEVYQMHKDGSATLTVKSDYTSSDAESIRSLFKSNSKSEIQKQYLTYYQNKHKNVTKASNIKFDDDIENNTFVVYEHYNIPQLFEVEEETGKKYINFYSQHTDQYLPAVNTVRSAPIALSFPLKFEHDICIINPDGKQMSSASDTHNEQHESYFYSRFMRNSQDTLKLSYSFYTYKSYIDEEQVPLYVKTFQDRNRFFFSGFYLNDDYSVDIEGSSPTGQSTLYPILLFVLVCVLFTLFVRWYNKQKPRNTVASDGEQVLPPKLGGWLYVLGIVMIINLISSLLSNMLNYVTNYQIWIAYDFMELRHVSPIQWQVLLSLEFVISFFLTFALGYCLYLLYKRRDLFPQTCFYTLLAVAVFDVVSSMNAMYIMPESVKGAQESWNVLTRNIIPTIIWLSYLRQSERVKATFIVPYKNEDQPRQFISTALQHDPSVDQMPEQN